MFPRHVDHVPCLHITTHHATHQKTRHYIILFSSTMHTPHKTTQPHSNTTTQQNTSPHRSTTTQGTTMTPPTPTTSTHPPDCLQVRNINKPAEFGPSRDYNRAKNISCQITAHDYCYSYVRYIVN